MRFVPEGPSSTRVELEHRDLERMGELAAETRAAMDSSDGWAGLLDLFAGQV